MLTTQRHLTAQSPSHTACRGLVQHCCFPADAVSRGPQSTVPGQDSRIRPLAIGGCAVDAGAVARSLLKCRIEHFCSAIRFRLHCYLCPRRADFRRRHRAPRAFCWVCCPFHFVLTLRARGRPERTLPADVRTPAALLQCSDGDLPSSFVSGLAPRLSPRASSGASSRPSGCPPPPAGERPRRGPPLRPARLQGRRPGQRPGRPGPRPGPPRAASRRCA